MLIFGFFFFQAEDGIRARTVTGVQTCALPIFPALAAGATVGVATAALARRFGLVAGVCAGIFIAADPLFVDNSRDVRGYSLAALGSVVGTLLILTIHEEAAAKRPEGRRLVAYAVVMGLAISAQLFA